jgi:NADPH:quinone reductase-like Zn-dependent oxidoreductase
VQLAKAFGATVTGVASTAKAGLVRSIGADQVIEYTREDFADGHRHYDGGSPATDHVHLRTPPG